MIKLEKAEKPEVLDAKAAEWTAQIQAALAAGEKLSSSLKAKYNHATVKEAIVAETHGKCAYCESKVRHVAPGDIEHIVPKSIQPALWFEWSNLTLACPVCNTNKSDHEGFVDPHEDDPSEHFWFAGTAIFPRPESEKAIRTETVLKLNRSELHDRRFDRLVSLERLLRLASKQEDPDLRALLQQDLVLNETKSDREYAAMSRAFVANAKAQGLLP